MTCELAFDYISAHIDGQNTPEEEAALQAHLSVCPLCRATLEAMTGIEAQTRQLAEEAPPELKPRIMEAVRKDAAKRERRKRLLGPGAVLGAVAAVLALLLGTGVIRLPQRGASVVERNDAVIAETAVREDALLAAETGAYEPEANYGYAATDAPAAATEAAMEAPAEPEAELPEAPETAAEDGLSYAEILKNGSNVYSADGLSTAGRGLAHAARSALDDALYCAALSEAEEAPVLSLRGLDSRFLDTLTELEPELGALFAEAEQTEEDGRLVLALDTDTLFALQEWLLLSLPQAERTDGDEDEAPHAASSIERMTEFDPAHDCLTTIVTLEKERRLSTLPDCFPEDFAEAFFAEENWSLYYPREGYTPQHGAPAWLVLIPAEDAAD